MINKLEKILKNINISNAREVAYNMLVSSEHIHDLLFPELTKEVFNQHKIGGSGNFKKIKYKYDKHNFTLFLDDSTKIPAMSIYPKNNTDSAIKCLVILFSPAKKLAYIDNITYHSLCGDVGLSYPGGGTILLKMAVQFLKDNKEKLNINKIQLKDNSFLFCKNISKNIPLSSLYMLTKGDTWYGKHGFTPFMYVTGEDQKDFVIDYRVNKILVKKLTLKCTNIENIMKNAIVEHKLEQYITLDKFNKFCRKYESKPIINFFEDLMVSSKFKNTCVLFLYTFHAIMSDCGIVNLHGVSYNMNI
jgi:hypothetical protein